MISKATQRNKNPSDKAGVYQRQYIRNLMSI